METEKKVLEAVHRGQMTPEDAEAWARERGLPPFTGRPDATVFDPLDDPAWTFLQIYCWIAYRDIERLRDVSTGFRRHWRYWRRIEGYPETHTGYYPCRGRPLPQEIPLIHPSGLLEIFDDTNCSLIDERPLMTLQRVLVEGKLTAFRNSEPVPLAFWVCDVRTIDFNDIYFRSVEALKIWPSQPTEAEVAPEKGIVSAQNGRDVRSDKSLQLSNMPRSTTAAWFNTSGPTKQRSKRGRKSKIDWEMVYAEMTRLMEHNGTFSPDDPEWNCKACLEKAVRTYVDEKFGPETVKAESTIRDHVTRFLKLQKVEN